jgi:replicative DNA helicase
MREQEEDLIARTFNTYGAEFHHASQLTGEDFTEAHLGEIWEAVKATYCANWSYTDLLTAETFKTLKPKAREALLVLCQREKPLAKTDYLAQQVKEQAELKHARSISDLAGSMTLENKTSRLEEIKKLNALLEDRPETTSPRDQVSRAVDFINSLQREPEFISTNSPALNELIDGFHAGRLYVLAARTGIGKTAVALNLSWGLKTRAKVCFYSLEMTEQEILRRLASLETGTSNGQIKQQATSEINEVLARKFLPALETSGLEIIANPQGFTMAELRAHALKMKAEGKLEILFIDQLDKIKPSGRLASASEYEILTKHSTQLKQLALELEVPLVLLAQINREGNEAPTLKHLKGSGQLEQDADLVFLLDRKGNPSDKEIELSFNVAKNRHGKTGKIFYRWQGDLMRLLEPRETGFRRPDFNPADSVARNYSPAGTAF